MDTQETLLDDLTRIKGIGLTRQEWLRNVFQVRTYQDLACLSLEQLETQLKAEKQIASRREITAWLDRAQELAATVPNRQCVAAVSSDHPEPAQPLVHDISATDWQVYARFVVEFQTYADKVRSAREQLYRTVANQLDLATDRSLDSQSWSGLQSEPLSTWLQEQVHKQSQPAAPVEPQLAVKAALAAYVQIKQARLFQPPSVQTPRLLYPILPGSQAVITGSDSFALDIVFELRGAMADDLLAAQSLYRAQFYLINLATNAAVHLDQPCVASLTAAQLSYVVRLHCTALLPGLYRLHVLLSLESRPPVIDYVEVPLLQVI